MKRRLIVRHGRHMAMAVCGLLMGASMLQSCEDELLTGQPDWLGNSIYERLQNDPDGQSYSTLLRLIDDMGQKEVMSHTGSKTLFAADDNAFKRWFQTNRWGVTKYEQLTKAQKSLLLNSAMVNNAYLIELLSNAAATGSSTEPTKGVSMRRTTALSIYDSVSVVTPAQMPSTEAWAPLYEANKPVPMFKDATAAPIIHFLPEFMKSNSFTPLDIQKLTNGKSSSVDVSWINGVQVTKENITCKNGYIHKVAEVVEPVFNMAQIMRDHESMSTWSHLIDRFSAPFYNASGSQEYNRLYNTDDSVYTLRYFSDLSVGNRALNVYPDGTTPANDRLIFDPGWNQYMYTSDNKDLHYDAAAMLVPNDEVLNRWWNSSALKTQYGDWDNVPNSVLAELLNNNMIDAFVNSTPSKFSSIVDDSQVRMGIVPEDVDSCFIGCNGVIYLTNKVFAPSSFASVSFPAMVRKDIMNIIYWAIEQLNFKPFLNSMEATYSLILPTNTAMLTYIDPTMYGLRTNILYQFYFDPTASEDESVKALRYEMTLNDEGKWECKSFPIQENAVDQSVINNRLKDLMNSLIIVGKLNKDQEYYKTRGGSVVRITNIDEEGQMTVSGGYQLEDHGSVVMTGEGIELSNNEPALVETIYDQTKETNGTGNGMAYQVSNGLPMSATKSLYMLLKETPEFKGFFDLLNSTDADASLLATTMGSGTGNNVKYCNNDKGDNSNVTLFEGYNYTIYVPGNDVISNLISLDYLPTWADVANQKRAAWQVKNEDGSVNNAKSDSLALVAKNILRNRINDFVRYHIQDNSLFVKGEPVEEGRYESSKVNPENNRFYTLAVTSKNGNMTVTGQYAMDANGQPQSCFDANGRLIASRALQINTEGKLYNKMIREFWNEGNTSNADGSNTYRNKLIFTVSDGVVHQLKDGALFFSEKQMTSWKDELEELKMANGIE